MYLADYRRMLYLARLTFLPVRLCRQLECFGYELIALDLKDEGWTFWALEFKLR